MPSETMIKWDAARVAREADPTNPELIKAEFDAEQEHFRRVREADHSRVVRGRVLTILTILAIAASVWFANQKIDQVNTAAEEAQHATTQVHKLTIANKSLTLQLQEAVIESCEQTGNKRAEVQREQLREEIEETEHPDPEAFKALVEAGVPPKAINESERRTREKLEERIARVHLVKCAEHYRLEYGAK